MKKILVFAMIAMVAGFASAQTLSFFGNSAIYNVDNTTWYNASANWGTGGAFDVVNFGLVATLTLGGNCETWWDDNASHPGTTVEMGYQVDAQPSDAVSLPHLSFGSNNDKFENMTGEDVIATSGVGGGAHTVSVWFHANDGVTDFYDNNSSANYTADFQTIPEPATMSLLGLGAVALLRKRN